MRHAHFHVCVRLRDSFVDSVDTCTTVFDGKAARVPRASCLFLLSGTACWCANHKTDHLCNASRVSAASPQQEQTTVRIAISRRSSSSSDGLAHLSEECRHTKSASCDGQAAQRCGWAPGPRHQTAGSRPTFSSGRVLQLLSTYQDSVPASVLPRSAVRWLRPSTSVHQSTGSRPAFGSGHVLRLLSTP